MKTLISVLTGSFRSGLSKISALVILLAISFAAFSFTVKPKVVAHAAKAHQGRIYWLVDGNGGTYETYFRNGSGTITSAASCNPGSAASGTYTFNNDGTAQLQEYDANGGLVYDGTATVYDYDPCFSK